MKIKVHNSMSKISAVHGDLGFYRFIFDEKIILTLSDKILLLSYQIDDNYQFIKLFTDTKELEEGHGFGENEKNHMENWWKYSRYQWKEMSE